MIEQNDVLRAIITMLERHEFVMNAKGDMIRRNTGCVFYAESLRKYKTVVDFQIDYPYYA